METSEFSPLRYLVNGLNINKPRSISAAYLTELSQRDDVRKALIPLVKEGTKQERSVWFTHWRQQGVQTPRPQSNR